MNKKASQPERKRLRVLIADDSASVRVSLSFLISDLTNSDVIGFAWTGDEALKLIHELKPDVVTLDIRMPGMNGLEVLEALRKKKRRPLVMVLSGLNEDEFRRQCLKLGADHFFAKDEDLGGLVKVLNNYSRGLRGRVRKTVAA
jgi:CheY-like chemotaxis protein